MGHEKKAGRAHAGEPNESQGLRRKIADSIQGRMSGNNRLLSGQETGGLQDRDTAIFGGFGRSVRELARRPFRHGGSGVSGVGKENVRPPGKPPGGEGAHEAPDPNEFYHTSLFPGEALRAFVGSDSPTFFTVPQAREPNTAEDPGTAMQRGEAELIFTQVGSAVKDLGLNAIAASVENKENEGSLDLRRGVRARFVDRDRELLVSTVFGDPHPHAVYAFASEGMPGTGSSNNWTHSQTEGLRIAGAEDVPEQVPSGQAYAHATQRLQSVVDTTEAVYIDIPRRHK